MDKEIVFVLIWGIMMFITGIMMVIVAEILGRCKHKNKVIRTFYTAVTCEDTATFCQDCGKQLTDVKTDCR